MQPEFQVETRRLCPVCNRGRLHPKIVAEKFGRNRPPATRPVRKTLLRQPGGVADKGAWFPGRSAALGKHSIGRKSKRFAHPAWPGLLPASSAYRPAPCGL